MALTSVTQSHPHDWLYLAEGGSTIVFAYAGPFHPSFTRKVLRLRKIALTETLHDTVEEEEDQVIAFQKTVIAALVPPDFLPDLDIVLLDAQWLAVLEGLRDRDRPPERRAKDQIDKDRKRGILATDLVQGADVLAIEIKPKWGFLPNPAHLSAESAEIKTTTCRFCMHTRFKTKHGDLPTQYCPLDFFSTDEARNKKAIRDLWDGWVQSDGALNNMRIFVAGKTMRPSESYAFLEEFLSTSQVSEAFIAALLPSLRSPALKIISNLQRSLDALDIEGLVKLYAMAHPDAKDWASIVQPSLEQLQDFSMSYHSTYRTLDHSKLFFQYIDTYIMAHLLSATFKDCSVIFRIRRSETPSVDSPGTIFIIDLDLKGVDRLEKWVNIDREIVEYYRGVVLRKRCVEFLDL